APFAFAVGPMLRPGAVSTLLATGLGAAAVVFPALALAGGYALTGGTRWLRILCGALTIGFIGALPTTVPTIGGTPISDPRGAWVAILATTLTVVLILATAAPLRRTIVDSPVDAG